MRSWLFFSLFLAACGPRVHPLQGQRDALEELARTPLPASWQPDLTVVLSESLEAQLVALATDTALDAVPERLELSIPLMGDVGLVPELQRPTLGMRRSDKCDRCTRIDLGWAGRLRMVRTQKEDVFRLTSDMVVTSQIRLEDTEQGQDVVFQVLPDAPHGARVKIPTIPALMAPMVNGALTAELERQLAEGELGKPHVAATLPSSKGLALRDVRLEVAPHYGLSAALLAEGAVPVPPLDEPANGWEARVASPTALGVLRSVAAHQELVYGLAVEPVALSLQDDHFELDLRLRKAARRERYRDYHVSGTVALTRDHRARVHALEITPGGGEGYMMKLVQKRFVRQLEGALARSVKVEWPFTLGERDGHVRLTEVRLRDDLLVLAGEVATRGGGVKRK